jgi:protein O-mannosyl-transferase
MHLSECIFAFLLHTAAAKATFSLNGLPQPYYKFIMAKSRSVRPNQPQQTRSATSGATAHSASESAPSSGLRWILGVLAITFALYIPSLSNQYVNWDDDPNITENPNLERLHSGTLANIFSIDKGQVIGNYNPLPIATFAAEKYFFDKLDPRITHWGNLLLHLGCVLLAYFLLRRMGMGAVAAAFGALLFGIHPMRVESVAWATERKDVLFGLFFFAALIYYTKWIGETESKAKYYILMILMAVLSCFSKVQAVALPLAMLCLDYWFKRPLNMQRVIEKAPFWLISLVFGSINIYTLSLNKSLDDITSFNFFQRLVIGAYSFCTYLYKLVLPYPMQPMYPYPESLPAYFYLAPLVVAAFWYFIWKAYQQDKRSLVFGSVFFLFNVVFVLQIIGAGQGYLADRFTYIPYFGFFALAAWYLDERLRQNSASGLLNTACFGFLALCAVLTVKQIGVWKNGETLWTHVMKGEGRTIALPYGNRANYYRGVGQYEKSLTDYTEAISISPNKPDLYNSRGKTYFDMAMSGKYKAKASEYTQNALNDYTKGLSFDKNSDKNKAELYINRGAAHGASNLLEKSFADFAEAEKLDPANDNLYLNRCLAHFNAQQYDKAIQDHTKLLEIDPFNTNIYYERGLCYRILNRPLEAIPTLTRAIELKPDFGLAYLERARAYAMSGNMALAKSDGQKALQLKTEMDQATRQILGF